MYCTTKMIYCQQMENPASGGVVKM